MPRTPEQQREWDSRLDPDAYSCAMRMEAGAPVWSAQCAGQSFEYTLGQGGTVYCASASGGVYALTVEPDSEHGFSCRCPVGQRGIFCKHVAGFTACLNTRRRKQAA